MACDCPNIAVFAPRKKSNEKRILRVMFSWNARDYDAYVGSLCENFSGKDDHSVKRVYLFDRGLCEVMLLPCGHCIGCRLEYSRQWAIRCVLESMLHECNFFITLTYDDLHLPTAPRSMTISDDTGEVLRDGYSHPLDPPALTKFFKDLRRYYSYHYKLDGIRFFACGEYGDKSGRPHYHAIIFNLPIFDLKFYKRSFDGHPLYTSEILNNIWGNGYVVIAECCYDTCAYVARYITKKQVGRNKDFYDYMALVPEFVRMSRRPGIAKGYYDANSDHIYDVDHVTIVGADGKAIQPRPPKYFDACYADDGGDLDSIKDERMAAQQAQTVAQALGDVVKPSVRLQSNAGRHKSCIIQLKRGAL